MKRKIPSKLWASMCFGQWHTLISGIQRRFDREGCVYYRARQGDKIVNCATLTEAFDQREILLSIDFHYRRARATSEEQFESI